MFNRISVALVALAFTGLGVTGPRVDVRAQGGREHTVYLSVVDKDDAPVTDLGPQEIVIREDNARREVLRVSRAVEPIDIALLVDDSEAAGPVLIHLRQALTRFIETMHRDHNIAVVGLAQRPTIFTDYTQSLGQLKAAVGRVFAQTDSGMTLLDALVEVSRGLEKRETPRAAIVAILTDGPEQGHYDDRTVIEAIEKAGASFNAVTVGRFTSVQPEEHRYRVIALEKGTADTGGRHRNLMAASGLPTALDAVARQLTSQLKVVYSRPESLIPPESLEVSVTRPGLSARATPARRAGGQP